MYSNNNFVGGYKLRKLLILFSFLFSSTLFNVSVLTIGGNNVLENSLFNLDKVFTNQNGENITLQDIKGDVKVISMIYTRCKTTCPILLDNMMKLDSLISKDVKGKVHFILVSLDPSRDTYLDMKKFGEVRGLDYSRWSLLTGSVDNVLQLAVSLGIKYKKEVDGSYVHSNLIIVLDKCGNIVYNHPGLNDDLFKLVHNIYANI